MNNFMLSFLVVIIIAILCFTGCSSSKDTTEKRETTPPVEIKKTTEPPPVTTQPPIEKKIDTVKVDVQDNQKPTYEPKSTPPPPPQTAMPIGKFSVQIGAYKMPDNADRIAALAKERFNLNVYTSVDKIDNLYKVMIGDFNSKDEARNFRDEMARKFPIDYKDAWVSENPQK